MGTDDERTKVARWFDGQTGHMGEETESPAQSFGFSLGVGEGRQEKEEQEDDTGP